MSLVWPGMDVYKNGGMTSASPSRDIVICHTCFVSTQGRMLTGSRLISARRRGAPWSTG